MRNMSGSLVYPRLCERIGWVGVKEMGLVLYGKRDDVENDEVEWATEHGREG